MQLIDDGCHVFVIRNQFAPVKRKLTSLVILLIGTETETKAFMAICVETLKRFVWQQLNVFSFVVDVNESLLLLYLFVCFEDSDWSRPPPRPNATWCER